MRLQTTVGTGGFPVAGPAGLIVRQAGSKGVEIEPTVASRCRAPLAPGRVLRQGWADAAKLQSEVGEDGLLLDVSNDFDREEWAW